MYYTIGQHKGLGIGGQKEENQGAWFVCKKDLTTNVLYVAQGNQDSLYSTALTTAGFNWIPKKPDCAEFECFAKFRYRQADQKVLCKIEGDNVHLEFLEPQRAITQGQFAVLYDIEENCLGGGEIDKIFMK